MVCTSDVEEQVFLMATGFHLQKSTIILLSNIIEMVMYFDMPSNHTDEGTSANSVVIGTSDSEKM
jgi:hypothetical protein